MNPPCRLSLVVFVVPLYYLHVVDQMMVSSFLLVYICVLVEYLIYKYLAPYLVLMIHDEAAAATIIVCPSSLTL